MMITVITHLIINNTLIAKVKKIKPLTKEIKLFLIKMLRLTAFNKNSKLLLIKNPKTKL